VIDRGRRVQKRPDGVYPAAIVFFAAVDALNQRATRRRPKRSKKIGGA